MGEQDGILLAWLQGVSEAESDRLTAMDGMQEYLRETMTIRVAGADSSQPGILGEYKVGERRIEFQSKFPIQKGIQYEATYAELTLLYPELKPEESDGHTTVSWIYPSDNQLPANLLKFYISFSAPMSRGYGYQFIRLLDEAGQEVVDPFPAIGVELWNRDQTQFTLLLDPGRIKRGIGINESMGLPLVPGKTYQLAISNKWPDANGNPMDGTFAKEFKVIDPDHATPDVRQWLVNKPPTGSSEPMYVDFNEPMDYSLADRMVWIETATGNILNGEIKLSNNETRLIFRPSDFKWISGEYAVGVHSRYEDLAGNQIEKPFEVDVESAPAQSNEIQTYKIPFTIP
jgi:hypothetical protein